MSTTQTQPLENFIQPEVIEAEKPKTDFQSLRYGQNDKTGGIQSCKLLSMTSYGATATGVTFK